MDLAAAAAMFSCSLFSLNLLYVSNIRKIFIKQKCYNCFILSIYILTDGVDTSASAILNFTLITPKTDKVH